MVTRVQRLQEVAVEGRDIVLHGLYIAERIDTRFLDAPRLASAPLVVEAGEDGLCVIFRYGVLVFVQVSPGERVRFQQEVDVLLRGRFDEPVTVTEKPEVLWDHPRLDPLYARVEDELELVARQRALERKLAVAEQATRVVLELRQHTQSLRVEWYIVVLILAEIAISLYQLSR